MEYDAQLAEIKQRLKNLEEEQKWTSKHLRGNGQSLPTKLAILETKQIDLEEEFSDLENQFDSWLVRLQATANAREQNILEIRKQLRSVTASCPTPQQVILSSFARQPLKSTVALIAIIAALHYFEGAIALVIRLFSGG